MENTTERTRIDGLSNTPTVEETPKTLQEQVDKLHNEVLQIAKDMASLHATEKAVDQKATVIGRALIEQKNSSERVVQNQAEVNETIVKCTDHVTREQERLLNTVGQVDDSVKQLRNLETREDTLLTSLDSLSKDQQRFMEANRQFNKASNDDLAHIKDTMQNMRSMMSNMTIEDQVAVMEAKTGEIRGALEAYITMRTDLEESMVESMTNASTRLDSMQEDIEAQQKAIESVVEISHTCEKNTNLLCDKLELLLESQKATQSTKAQSLEDMFAEQDPVEIIAEASVPQKAIHDVTLAEEEAEDLSYLDDGEHWLDGVDDTEAETLEEPEETAERTASIRRRGRKKGFFSRMFGGGN